MPPPERKAGSLCVYILSALFFLVLAAGGALLIIYFVTPESESTIWFPIAGMVLVAIPWLFWIITCLYRSVATRHSPSVERPPAVRAAAVAPAMGGASTTSAADDSQVYSPGGARRVRFGTTTVIGSQDANAEAATAGGTTSKPGHEGDGGDSHATTASTLSNDDASLNSHESELPLAFAMK